MSTADPLIALPDGTFPLDFAPDAREALRGKKRTSDDEVVALRYAFKPASVTVDTPGVLEPAPTGAAGGSRVLSFDMTTGGSQVFDIREEVSKPRECVLVWSDERQTFTLHALPTTMHLSQNRTLSAIRVNGAFPAPEKTEAPAGKKARQATGGKGVARKQLPSDLEPVLPSSEAPKKGKKKAPAKKAAAKPKAAPKAKAAPKKGAAKKKGGKAAAASSPAGSKIKSVEIIEDSDDDMDEFADMLGDAMEAEEQAEAFDDEDDEEDVEEDEDDELGGAQYAGYSAAAEAHEEWI